MYIIVFMYICIISCCFQWLGTQSNSQDLPSRFVSRFFGSASLEKPHKLQVPPSSSWLISTGWWLKNNLEKYEFVNANNYPIYETKKIMFEPTNQYRYPNIWKLFMFETTNQSSLGAITLYLQNQDSENRECIAIPTNGCHFLTKFVVFGISYIHLYPYNSLYIWWYPDLVGGWALPLWKMMEWVRQLRLWNSQYMDSHKIHVPNHQPVVVFGILHFQTNPDHPFQRIQEPSEFPEFAVFLQPQKYLDPLGGPASAVSVNYISESQLFTIVFSHTVFSIWVCLKIVYP